MARIPEETLQAIRDRTDLVDLIGRYVHLKKSGRSFLGLCPFHQEKTPSFHVNPERQIFHCFGCHEGGNAFGFLMKHENLAFPEAARMLARDAGVTVPDEPGGPGRGVVERLLEANAIAQKSYRAALAAPEGEPARRYLAGRGLSAEECERFGIGYALPRWDALRQTLERAGIDARTAEQAGLLGLSERTGKRFDFLRGRVTFAIRNARGEITSFGGRALEDGDGPKYLNSRESPVYRKRGAFYGLAEARDAMRQRERAVIVEGYFDRIAMHRAGVEESLATCGTSLTVEHAQALRRRVREVVLVFDGDAAGRRALDAALRVLLPAGLRVRAALLPPGDDPDSLLVAEGADALRARVDAAPPAIDCLIDFAVEAGVATPWEKADAVSTVAPVLALVPEAVERREFAHGLALKIGADREDVWKSVEAAVAGQRGRDGAAARSTQADAEMEGVRPEVAARRDDPRLRWSEHLVVALIEHAGVADLEPAGDVLALVPESPVRTLLAHCFEAVAREGAAAPSRLADAPGLEGEALRLLHRLAAREAFREDEAAARRAFRDVVARLRARAARDEGRALTQKLAGAHESPDQILAAKDRVLDDRRVALGLGTSPR